MGFEPTYLVVCNLVRQYMDPFQACLLLIAVAENKFVYIQLKLKTKNIEPIKYKELYLFTKIYGPYGFSCIRTYGNVTGNIALE